MRQRGSLSRLALVLIVALVAFIAAMLYLGWYAAEVIYGGGPPRVNAYGPVSGAVSSSLGLGWVLSSRYSFVAFPVDNGSEALLIYLNGTRVVLGQANGSGVPSWRLISETPGCSWHALYIYYNVLQQGRQAAALWIMYCPGNPSVVNETYHDLKRGVAMMYIGSMNPSTMVEYIGYAWFNYTTTVDGVKMLVFGVGQGEPPSSFMVVAAAPHGDYMVEALGYPFGLGDEDPIEYLVAHVVQGLPRLQRLVEALYNSSLARP